MRRLALLFLFPAALSAAVPDPFPNQPGALSEEEVRAATEAMTAQLGGEKPLPLVASGKRAPEHVMPSYALYASPLVNHSDRVRTRRQVICNYFRPMSGWQCTKPQTEFRMTAQGIAHVFTHVVDSGPENRKDAVEVADYLYSGCFAKQYKALGGGVAAPAFNPFPITAVVSDRSGFTVRATGPDEAADVYRLERADTPGCKFTIQYARLGKAGQWLPPGYEAVFQEQARKAEERHEKERRKLAAEQHLREKQAQQARDPAAGKVDAQEWIATITMFAAMGFGGLSFFVPWLFVSRGRRAAATAAGILAVACTVSAVVSAIFMPMKYNIRIDLLINGALVVMAWLVFGGLAMWAAGETKSK